MKYVYIVFLNDSILGVYSNAIKASKIITGYRRAYLGIWKKGTWKTRYRGFNWSCISSGSGSCNNIARLQWERKEVK